MMASIPALIVPPRARRPREVSFRLGAETYSQKSRMRRRAHRFYREVRDAGTLRGRDGSSVPKD
jgi:hypothetical protein